MGWVILACSLTCGCDEAESNREVPTVEATPRHAELALTVAREDERVADAVEQALGERWPTVASLVQDTAHPWVSLEDVLRDRGLPDLEAGLPDGVFSTPDAHRRYFAALLLGWMAEPAALTIAARVEAQRLHSLSAAHAELPDVDQRLALDALARAASDRLHAFCRRLTVLGRPCAATDVEPPPITLKPRAWLEVPTRNVGSQGETTCSIPC